MLTISIEILKENTDEMSTSTSQKQKVYCLKNILSIGFEINDLSFHWFCRYLTWLWLLSEFSWSQRIRWPRGCYSSTSFSSNDEVFVCFCLQIFDECLSHIKSCTDIQLKAYLFLCRSQMSLKEIKWCQHDPDSVDWNGDYTDALFMHFEKYIFLWKKKSYFSCYIKL